MKFSLLMLLLPMLIKKGLKKHKYLRDMISNRKCRVIMMTKDGKQGKRFIIDKGRFSTDKNLREFDMGFVWREGNTAFSVMTGGDPVGMLRAEADRDLVLKGDKSLSIWFTIFMGYATGALKK